MAINPPVDATKTPEWAALQKHYDELQSEGISLKQWFADDAERVVLALREHRMFLPRLRHAPGQRRNYGHPVPLSAVAEKDGRFHQFHDITHLSPAYCAADSGC